MKMIKADKNLELFIQDIHSILVGYPILPSHHQPNQFQITEAANLNIDYYGSGSHNSTLPGNSASDYIRVEITSGFTGDKIAYLCTAHTGMNDFLDVGSDIL